MSDPEINTVSLSPADSKILAVSLYQNRAEITRLYKLSVKKGQNNVKINWLPWAIDTESLRVEGRGKATIHDVNLTTNPPKNDAGSTTTLDGLTLKKTRIEKALERCKRSIASLESFLGTVSAAHTKSSDLRSVVKDYDASAGELDETLLGLEQQLKDVEKEIQEERKKIAPKAPYERGRHASIGVVAEDSDIELVLIYAVTGATWEAGYDIRVDTTRSEKSVTLIYKAIVSQSTNETWENVPLTLETASPTYGVNLPSLDPWNISVYKPAPPPPAAAIEAAAPDQDVQAPGAASRRMFFSRKRAARHAMDHATSVVSSKGSVSATFRVPGLVNIPSDGGERSFTIAELELNAFMTWFSVPKIDTRVHLKAQIHNESEYTLLPGQASVYVDGSFISKSPVPAVSPLEKFDCPLGLDPSIRITYHPQSKKSTTSGFYQKSTSYEYIQRITIHNTKANRVPLLKIVDQIPVSEDAQITVKLVNPALKVPTGSTKPQAVAGSSSGGETTVVEASAGPNVKVAEGVVAQWDGADDPSVDVNALGKDGKINWLCDVAGQEKVNLTLQWEVSTPVKTQVVGL
ncbi:mucoidy inhibitor a [Moniliophthora roreri MCA 2997]|uniref:Mucoidy inhibitor a n=1 Tax=Moniliophthora roreri (strain MCA 2997) TaxID=1381753 RepID=V2XA22_MONRO|nr:mucoidy inhibitor a [Moniliophthora roreri MCA 2997]